MRAYQAKLMCGVKVIDTDLVALLDIIKIDTQLGEKGEVSTLEVVDIDEISYKAHRIWMGHGYFLPMKFIAMETLRISS